MGSGGGQKGCTVDQKFTVSVIFAAKMHTFLSAKTVRCGFYADSVRTPVEHRENKLFSKKKTGSAEKTLHQLKRRSKGASGVARVCKAQRLRRAPQGGTLSA
jgi:hypothetical protein